MVLVEANAVPPVPDILVARRSLAKTYYSGDRNVDDFETCLMALLDVDGLLTVPGRVDDFIILITRAEKVEYRLLALHVLTNSCSESILQQFVALGGLLILRKWLKNSVESSDNFELIKILEFFAIMPLDDVELIKRLKLGTALKKLQKHTDKDIIDRATKAREIWEQKLVNASNSAVKSYSVVGNDVKLDGNLPLDVSVTAEIGKFFVRATETVSAPTVEIADVDVDVGFPSPTPTPTESTSKVQFFPVEVETIPSLTVKEVEHVSTKVVQSVPETKSVEVEDAILASEVSKKPVPKKPVRSGFTPLSTIMPRINVVTSPLAVKPVVHTADHSGTVPVVDLADQEFASFSRRSSATGNTMATALLSMATATPSVHSRVAAPKKSILKKTVLLVDENVETAEPKPVSSVESVEKKKGIVWADSDESGAKDLTEVYTFEIETSFRKSVSDYQSTKEKEKKERQNERESWKKKTMTADIEWETPNFIMRPKVDEYNGDTVMASSSELVRPETETQSKETNRIRSVIEEKYYAGKSIPNDPGRPPVMSMLHGPLHNNKIVTIPYHLLGEAIDENNETTKMEIVPDIPSPDPISAVLDVLPPLIRALDHEILQHLVSNEQDLLLLLNEDGSVSEQKVLNYVNQYKRKANTNNGYGSTGLYNLSSASTFEISPSNNMSAGDYFNQLKKIEPSKQKDVDVCKYYGTSIGCIRGDSCKFLHLDSGRGANNNGKRSITLSTNGSFAKRAKK